MYILKQNKIFHKIMINNDLKKMKSIILFLFTLINFDNNKKKIISYYT